MSRRLAIAALAAAVPVLAACGGSSSSTEDFQGTEKQVAQVVEDLSDAGRDKDAKRICERLLAPAVVQQLKATRRDCVAAVDGALDDADNFDLSVTDVTVNGNRASAKVESGGDEDEVETLQLVRVGNGWRLASLGS